MKDRRAPKGIFAHWAPIYGELGLWPRPVRIGSKSPAIPRWQIPDTELSASDRASWLSQYSNHGIGLAMGSPIGDGTVLGALDVDRNEYVRLAHAVLGPIVSGRFGSKGVVIFVRVSGPANSRDFLVEDDKEKHWGKVAECLFRKRFCVIPPTVHPTTNAPYTWIGTPLHEIDLTQLPLIET